MADDDLRSRLAAVKGAPPAAAPVSDDELAQRLAQLNPGGYTAAQMAVKAQPATALPPRTVAPGDEVDALLLQSSDAVHLATGLRPELEGASRLATEAEEVDALLQMSSDAVRLETGRQPNNSGAPRGGGYGGISDDPLEAPSASQLRGLAGEAKGVLRDQEVRSAMQAARKPPAARAPGHRSYDVDEDEEALAAEAERLLAELADEPDDPPAVGVPVPVVGIPAAAAGGGVSFPSAPSHSVAPPQQRAPPAQPKPAAAATTDDVPQERWCCICNDDAVLWCSDCDGDPYCRRCFREGHPPDEPDMAAHRTVPIRQR